MQPWSHWGVEQAAGATAEARGRAALPTHEHFVPALVSARAAADAAVTFPISGYWWNGSLTRRSVQLT